MLHRLDGVGLLAAKKLHLVRLNGQLACRLHILSAGLLLPCEVLHESLARDRIDGSDSVLLFGQLLLLRLQVHGLDWLRALLLCVGSVRLN